MKSVSADSPVSSSQPESSLAVAQEKILVLDFGSQTAQLIARRVRENNVFCQLVRHDLSAERIKEIAPKGIILSGGPSSVYEAGAPKADPAIFELGIPVLGICYGMQLICHYQGGQVTAGTTREFGNTAVKIGDHDKLFAGLPAEINVFMSHGDLVQNIAGDFSSLAETHSCPVAAVKHNVKPIYAMQFHPEVTHTQFGTQIIGNFVKKICGCHGEWKMQSLIDQSIQDVRARVGNSRVICGLSGGVDSSVVAALLFKAIGAQLSCIFVDNGLLRKGEADQVKEQFTEHFKVDLHVVDARQLFLENLKGVTDPQKKRKIIGKLFIDCFKKEAEGIEDAHFLAQGTLYPDVIESGGHPDGPSATIKYHHNVGGLPEQLGFELVEPLRDLFKDEVRLMGQELGLPEKWIWRHPFPGPGLAVRCLGEITEEKLALLREADWIFIDELNKAGIYRDIQQAFAVLLPIQTVGVMGDGRTYEYVLALRAVDTDNFMTADWSRLSHDFLQRVSNRITNSIRGINRVVYDISSKPPATIEWE